MKKETSALSCLLRVFCAVLLASASLHAAEQVLVASNRSSSIEQFTTSGTWVRTFATTGPYAPTSLAQSPVTGEIFVTTMWTSGTPGQLTNIILRYQVNGHFDTNWDTFKVACGAPCPTSDTQSLLFDSSGNLWVATAYGEDLGGPIYIFKYLAADLTLPNPTAQPNPIVADMYRGDQMAFNASGNLCIAGFIDEDVQCFDTSTGAQTADYRTEIHASAVGGIEPAGLAFDGANRLYLTSVFTGQVLKELKPGGPIVLLATPVSSPSLLNGNLVLRGTNLYTPSFYNPAPTVSTPDPVYEVSISSGAVTNFIFGTAPPALGNDHIWGAYWMIFYSTTL
ncbi:MAG TPA: hypothetical protein VKR61_04335 [Bryobacteraceae bacterium]|nr:hypothetical protein [Bryobacteraceae bacterium]